MKIGIMTMQRIRNYGSFLQAYGLKKIIEKMGHEVVFVDYMEEAPVEELRTFHATKAYRLMKKIKRKAKIGVNKVRFLFKTEESEFSSFIKKFEKEYIPELGITKSKNYRTKVDVLVIGSDEVFNCTQGEGVGFAKELFGENNQAGKVISYAASFGNTTIEKLENHKIRDEVAGLLNNFSTISVRDRNSYEIVKELTKKSPFIHLDPVLIYDFSKEVVSSVREKDYIIVYAYNGRISEEEGKMIRDFADAKKKKIISISGKQPFCDQYIYCRPLEMLAYFKNASYVITDTFHGTIFSVINHKKFVTLVRTDGENTKGYGNQEKLGYLLEKLELEDRRLDDICQLSQIMVKGINYDNVDGIIEHERKRTIDYLQENLTVTGE